MKRITLVEALKRMFVDRHCLSCGEVISYDSEYPFCTDCSEGWYELLKMRCRRCGRAKDDCVCLPSKIGKICGGTASWSMFYDSGAAEEARAFFGRLKRKYNRCAIDMCTDMMKKNLVQVCRSRGIKYKDFVVTYAPRRQENLYKYGFDQSRMLAKSLAKKLGIKMICTLVNVGETEQKGLSKDDRALNAAESYEYIENSIGENKNIFLVDDIMTSGATLYACAFHLYSAGALNVVPVVFAKDNYKTKGVEK